MKTESGDVGNTSGKYSAELKTRVRTGTVLAVIGIFVLNLSHIPYTLNTVAAFLSIFGIYELLWAVKAMTLMRMLVLSLVSIMICFLKIPHYPIILSIAWAVSVIAFLIFMKRIGISHFTSFTSILPCTLMLPLFFRSIAEIRQTEQGFYYLVIMVFVCVFNDVAAFLVGKAIGGRKLAPAISPGKTVAGSLGGLVFSTVPLLILSCILSYYTGIQVQYGVLTLYLILASLVGQFGDLSMSVIKRSAGIKDFGTILPGHGGILDRFDSLLFVAPFSVIFCYFTNGFFTY
ncbi:MAG: phosphatidate cytidylyltransferase [Faecousia sp.]